MGRKRHGAEDCMDVLGMGQRESCWLGHWSLFQSLDTRLWPLLKGEVWAVFVSDEISDQKGHGGFPRRPLHFFLFLSENILCFWVSPWRDLGRTGYPFSSLNSPIVYWTARLCPTVTQKVCEWKSGVDSYHFLDARHFFTHIRQCKHHNTLWIEISPIFTDGETEE